MPLQLLATKTLGRRKFHFTVQGATFFDTVTEYDRLSFPDVPACGICGSDNLDLDAYVAQDKFRYTVVRCLDCRASLAFGKRQDDEHTVYLRRNAQQQLDWQPMPAK